MKQRVLKLEDQNEEVIIDVNEEQADVLKSMKDKSFGEMLEYLWNNEAESL